MPNTHRPSWRRHARRWTCLPGIAWLAAWLTLGAAVPAQAQSPRPAAAVPPLPLETFFQRADFRGAQLSPSGRWLAVLTRVSRSRVGLSMVDLQGREQLRFIATSPVEQVARIQAPVLLAHGGLDRRVPVENGTRMRDALQKAGKPVEWVVYPDEGHGFEREENAIDFHRRVEAFLARHLKP